MTLSVPAPLVSVDWLAARRDAPELVLLDASVPPIVPFARTRLPDALLGSTLPLARRFDYDQDICDPLATLPHMMPSAAQFTEAVRRLGISRNSAIVVYDDVGVYASPRAWWMFRAMGHDNIAVLDGGLPAWWQAGLPLSPTWETTVELGDFTAEPQRAGFCDALEVLSHLQDPATRILDARSPGRFAGRDPEPRPGLRRGHIPGSSNLPFLAVLDDIRLKPAAELQALFAERVKPEQSLIFSCGSGLTACILALAAAVAGHDPVRLSVYDGSWSEWGQPSKLPVARAD